MPEREPPSQRDHDTYAADHWTVVDVGEESLNQQIGLSSQYVG